MGPALAVNAAMQQRRAERKNIFFILNANIRNRFEKQKKSDKKVDFAF
jgi:hypothetical protein